MHSASVEHLRAQDKVILQVATQVQQQHTCYLNNVTCLPFVWSASGKAFKVVLVKVRI